MDAFGKLVEQVQLYVGQWASFDISSHVMSTAAIILVGGIVVGMLGAKLARFGLTTMFIVAGGALGAIFAQQQQVNQAVCVLVGAALLGGIGYLSFRVCVGLMAALVLSSLALGGFGYARVLPHVAGFEHQLLEVTAPATGSEATAGIGEQVLDPEGPASEWFRKFWAYVGASDAQAYRIGPILAIASLLIGMLVGLLAERFTLVVSTSVIGTVMLATGVAMAARHLMPETYQAAISHPSVIGGCVGGALALSIVVQTLMTRTPRQEAQGEEAEA